MKRFDAAPLVPSDYGRLSSLKETEIAEAKVRKYIGDESNPSDTVSRIGVDNSDEAPANDDVIDWRTRMYVIWFCYIFENFMLIDKPLYAVEELIIEFHAQDILNLPGRRIATLYAGAGAADSRSSVERQRSIARLKPHYDLALSLLAKWDKHHVL